MLVVTGRGSAIIHELAMLLPSGEEIIRCDAGLYPPEANHYVLCAGLLRPKTIDEQTPDERTEGINVNGIWPIQTCEHIIEKYDRARIVVIGSESAYTGSHDGIYAGAKVMLHQYVETKLLRTPQQQLVCVAPSIICDAGMTLRRTDMDRVAERAAAHPKRRFMLATEVAALVHFLLYIDMGYLTGITIRMNGGEHTK